MLPNIKLLAALATLSSALTIQDHYNSITANFQKSLSPGSKIILHSDPNYTNLTVQRWTEYQQPTYAAAIVPALESDVQAIVRPPFSSSRAGTSQKDIR